MYFKTNGMASPMSLTKRVKANFNFIGASSLLRLLEKESVFICMKCVSDMAIASVDVLIEKYFKMKSNHSWQLPA